MAHGRLNYQFAGTPKASPCTACDGNRYIKTDGRMGICMACHGTGMRATQIEVAQAGLKFTAQPIVRDGRKIDSFILKVNGEKFGELHGIDMDGYSFYFNRDSSIVAWIETPAIDTVWTGAKGGFEMAKRHYLKAITNAAS